MPSASHLVRRSLANGLEVLLYPSFDAPVASFQVWYRVGSRDEHPGLTGASHWVEHMMFKGTEQIGPGEVMLTVNANGGELNAFTSYDFTAYHETLPADRIGIAVEIEADRMTGLTMNSDQTESERTVILSERQGALNNPSYLLWDETIGTAFRSHGYRHFVIGTEQDLQAMTRDDLYGHYRRFYAPNNAVVVVTGAFDVDTMFANIEQAFGGIESSSAIERQVVIEPDQIAERRVKLIHPAPAPEVLLAWHVPGADSADEVVFEMLAGVLSGAGGRMGRSARLPRALVATGKARSASASYLKGIDPFAFLLSAGGLPDGNPEALEALLLEQIELIVAHGVSDQEVEKARKLLSAAFHFGSESVTAQAVGIGEAAMYGDAARFFAYPDEIAKVSATDIQRVALTWLTDKNRTTGLLVPSEAAPGAEIEPTLAALRFGIGGAGAPALRPFERFEPTPGLVVLGQSQPGDPVVHARIRVEAGSADDIDGGRGVANLAGALMMRGTGRRDRSAFEDACDDLGASIGVSTGREFTEFSITCLSEDLEDALHLVDEAWSEPSYAGEQLDLARREAVAGIRQANDRTDQVADQLLRDALFPGDHPLRIRPAGIESDVLSIDRDALVSFHHRILRGRPVSAAVVGGIDDVGRVANRLLEIVGANTGRSNRSAFAPASISLSTEPAVRELAGKEQADIALGMPVLGVSEPDWYAFDVADSILGSYGMMGRIGDKVRQEQGLAYYAYCNASPRLDKSVWTARAGVDPENITLAIDSIRAVLEEVRANGFEDVEVAGTKALMTGRVALGLETNAGIAAILLMIEQFGLGLDYVDRYPVLVNAVTGDSARAAAIAHLDPAHLAIAIARPKS